MISRKLQFVAVAAALGGAVSVAVAAKASKQALTSATIAVSSGLESSLYVATLEPVSTDAGRSKVTPDLNGPRVPGGDGPIELPPVRPPFRPPIRSPFTP